ncbi:MAG TPA: GspE/PulE family protein [Bryobacteraceae bacterium]|nr:GspE/PulE family protein [Bryobacteraceae bacterium]HOQ44131.1 GspE/PulE family protein [Bryobacteraceae bacterium]HPQ15912.1 GspE/PulE family protein [Bryobacteraceae bacterium]HPU70449.1 GspE/PulE family protein [Bryobacteraceae bacterium]
MATTERSKIADPAQEALQAQELARRYRYEYVDLREGHIDHDLFRSIPVELMFRYNFVPLRAENGTLEIALADPRNLNLIDELTILLQKKLRVKVASLSQISDLLKKTEQSQRVLEEVTESFTLDVVADEENAEETLSIDRLTGAESDIAPVIRLVDTTIFNALERRASDIHIETRDTEVAIKYRIDGVLHYAMPPIAKEWHSTILSRIKVMSELDIAERRVPQDGRFRVRYKNRLIDFRVSIMPTIHGEDAVLRVLDKESMSEKFAKLTLDVVGFPESDLAKFRRYIKEPYGMVLVTGPTGSGKTTTLYAALSEIKNDEDKIITIEDPVEYQVKGITQIPVNEKKGLTFARGLRSILRHDPDKIMVGEIRDQETAQIAINAALTGHLVFTTVHANNVFDVLGRFLNMGVEPYNFVSALNCILAQRLVRVICEHCKRRAHYTDAYLIESGLDPEKWRDVPLYEGEGCFECGGTGFRGRTAITELLDLSERIREMILDKRPTSEIKRVAREEGMTFLRECALDKARAGITTLREINKVTFIEG